ncbi:hypothetical protein EXU30_18880 [Shewanella maritima]|uniref:Uncharacterized protein n=1 Tax=Shewanella maritima TaxID=2520507 RepID=A0A411PLZ2_9GAMM|nr:hypothetical protein [Shewanella maritima]QBF84498.1 hypothetical protein EXU30_18880 [Shewanella maritima]
MQLNSINQASNFTQPISLSQAVAGNRAPEVKATVDVKAVNRANQAQFANQADIIEGELSKSQSAKSQNSSAEAERGNFELTQALKSQLDELISASNGANLAYDDPSSTQRGAISEYLTTQHSAKREEIQQMVGIDIYA